MTKVKVLWVGEEKPDTFSTLIQWKLKRNYSHVEILFNGCIWHCAEKGVIDERPEEAHVGSVIRYEKEFELICDPDVFQADLEGERGKGYGTWQNWGIVFPWLKHLLANADALRNCSEFVGVKINKYLPYHSPFILQGDPDWWTPADLEQQWKPDKVG